MSEPLLQTGLIRRHVVFGWWAVLAFLTLGIALELMHALKVGWYLNASNETRRLMWRLAHAHGVLLGVLNLCFAFSLRVVDVRTSRWPRISSPCLLAANVLLPGGFFLGGVVVYGGDPGAGVLLVPFGAVLLLVGVLSTALGFRKELGSAVPATPPA